MHPSSALLSVFGLLMPQNQPSTQRPAMGGGYHRQGEAKPPQTARRGPAHTPPRDSPLAQPLPQSRWGLGLRRAGQDSGRTGQGSWGGPAGGPGLGRQGLAGRPVLNFTTSFPKWDIQQNRPLPTERFGFDKSAFSNEKHSLTKFPTGPTQSKQPTASSWPRAGRLSEGCGQGDTFLPLKQKSCDTSLRSLEERLE